MSLCLIDDKSYQFVYALHQIGTRIGGTGLGDMGNAVTLCTRHQRRHAALLTKLRSKDGVQRPRNDVSVSTLLTLVSPS